MNRRLGICLLSLVAVTALCSTIAVGTTTDGTELPQQDGFVSPEQPQSAPIEFDNTAFWIEIYQNRSAQWTVEYYTSLGNESDEAHFEEFASRFNAEETDLYTNFRNRAQQITSTGRNATGRPMNATAFSRVAKQSERPSEFAQSQGVVRMSFVWSEFARSQGDEVVVDDVFAGGMYVDEGQRLVFQRGPELAFVEVDPEPDSISDRSNLAASESVTWVGERRFNDQRPHATLGARAAVGGSGGGETAGEGSTGGETGSDQTGGDFLGILPMVLIGAVLVVAVAGTLAWQRGYLPPGEGETATAPAGAESQTGSADGSGTEAQVAGGGGAAAAQVTEEELLSDEDRVMKLLDENGGRMKQVAIVEETDWSKSKVSMLLSDMEEEGQISKLRLGRENIISVAGQEPDAAGSPFEDE